MNTLLASFSNKMGLVITNIMDCQDEVISQSGPGHSDSDLLLATAPQPEQRTQPRRALNFTWYANTTTVLCKNIVNKTQTTSINRSTHAINDTIVDDSHSR